MNAENLRRREAALAEIEADDRIARRRYAEREQLQLIRYVGDAAAHQPLHGIDGARRVVDQHAESRVAGQDFARG